jgi:hypothetical protein
MRSDTTLRPSYYPRGIVISTGEQHPSGVSTLGRMPILPVKHGDIDLEKLTTGQEMQADLSYAMRAYIKWLQEKGDAFRKRLRETWQQYRNACRLDGKHTRQHEIYAHLMTAWETFLDFASPVPLVPADARERLMAEGQQAILQAVETHSRHLEDADPVKHFLSVLQEKIDQQKVYLKTIDGKAPIDKGESWGWIVLDAYPPQPAPGAEFIGWVDDDWLYLLSDATYKLVFEQISRTGGLLINKNALWRQLHEANLTQIEQGRFTNQKRAEERKRRVLQLRRDAIIDRDTTDEEDHKPD